MDQNCLKLARSHGFSSDIRGGVVNLSTSSRKAVAYIAGHCGVIFDCQTRKQTLLLGHRSRIKAIAVDTTRTIIITAEGHDDENAFGEGLVAVWDALTGKTLSTFRPNLGGGVVALSLAQSGDVLAVTGGASSQQQQLGLWAIAEGGKCSKLCQMELPVAVAGDVHACLCFRKDPTAAKCLTRGSGSLEPTTLELVSTGYQSICFGLVTAAGEQNVISSKEGAIVKFHCPAVDLPGQKLSRTRLGTSIFIPEPMPYHGPYVQAQKALTATEDGCVICWEASRDACQRQGDVVERTATKAVRLHAGPINILTTCGLKVVTGGEDGNVRFFDEDLRIECWFEDLKAGAIHSISFAQRRAPSEESTIPNFCVATAASQIIYVEGSRLEDMDNQSGEYTKCLLQGFQCPIIAMEAHPLRHSFVLLSSGSFLFVVDIEGIEPMERCYKGLKENSACGSIEVPFSKKTRKSDQSAQETTAKNISEASAMKISTCGSNLAIGFSTGQIRICEGLFPFRDIQTMGFTGAAIKCIAFSCDERLLACADSSFCIRIIKELPKQSRAGDRWEPLGKIQAHLAPIVGMKFWGTPSAEKKSCRLFSVGEDGVLQDIDLESSTRESGILLRSSFTISHPSVPTSFFIVTKKQKNVIDKSLDSSSTERNENNNRPVLWVCSSDNKLRLIDLDQQEICETVRAPCNNGPIKSVFLFSVAGDSNCQCIAFTTGEMVAGVSRFPLSASSDDHIELIAHSDSITSISVSQVSEQSQEAYLITSGRIDGTVNLWEMNLAKLRQQAREKIGQTAEAAWQEHRGPLSTQLYDQALEYFRYFQLIDQGEEGKSRRQITNSIRIIHIPNFLRALGCYLSSQEETDILAFLKSKKGSPITEFDTVSFTECLALYINFRPSYSVDGAHIEEALHSLLPTVQQNSDYHTKDIFDALCTRGTSPLSCEELERCLGCLAGLITEEERSNHIPAHLSGQELAENVLGFDFCTPSHGRNEGQARVRLLSRFKSIRAAKNSARKPLD